jgi:hypothetical protein
MTLIFGVYYDPEGMVLEDSACSLEVFCSAADGSLVFLLPLNFCQTLPDFVRLCQTLSDFVGPCLTLSSSCFFGVKFPSAHVGIPSFTLEVSGLRVTLSTGLSNKDPINLAGHGVGITGCGTDREA